MQTIYHKREPRTLSAAYRFYCGKELDNAHSAEADVLASIDILRGQMEKYPDMPQDMAELHEYCDQREPNWIDSMGRFKWINEQPSFAFAKHSGKPLRVVAEEDPGYLKWMVTKGNFPNDTKKIAQDALQGKFPVRKHGLNQK